MADDDAANDLGIITKLSHLPVAETVAKLKARGVVFRGDIVDDAQLLVANFQDSDGNPFYLAEPKAEYQRTPQPALN